MTNKAIFEFIGYSRIKSFLIAKKQIYIPGFHYSIIAGLH